MARSGVPKFGNWENDGSVPYTVYFEKARKNRGGGKVINPNDPQENPDMFPSPPGPDHKATSREERDFRRFTNSPAHTGQSYGGGGRPTRRSEGSDQGFERSPLHPHYQAKVAGRRSGSPSWEGKSHDSSHGTPGRSRLKPAVLGNESPEKVAAVPKFGDWNEKDPQAGENFTYIFNNHRKQRKTPGPSSAPGTPRHPSAGGRPQQAKEPKKLLCFWC